MDNCQNSLLLRDKSIYPFFLYLVFSFCCLSFLLDVSIYFRLSFNILIYPLTNFLQELFVPLKFAFSHFFHLTPLLCLLLTP